VFLQGCIHSSSTSFPFLHCQEPVKSYLIAQDHSSKF